MASVSPRALSAKGIWCLMQEGPRRTELLKRREVEIRSIAYVLFKQDNIKGNWEDLVSDLTREVDCLRYQGYWQSKGIAVIEQQAFYLVAKRWLTLPRPGRTSNIPGTISRSLPRSYPIHFQLREGFEMMKAEPLDVELEDTRDPSFWISVMDSGQKDLIRDNY